MMTPAAKPEPQAPPTPKLYTQVLDQDRAAIMDPCQHTLLAHEPTPVEVKRVFIENPTSKVIISVNGYYARRDWI